MAFTPRMDLAAGISASILDLQYAFSLLKVLRSFLSIFLSCDFSVRLTTKCISLPWTAENPRLLSLCSTILWFANVSRLSAFRLSSASENVSSALACHTALEQDVLTTSWKRRSSNLYLSTMSSLRLVAAPDSERNLSETATASPTLARRYSKKSCDPPSRNLSPECSTSNASKRSRRESRPVSSTLTFENAPSVASAGTPSSSLRVQNCKGTLLTT
mmetsp:Transcript_8484/g.24244  ORF Transcript_8484/g.24244 Transcript_8484/m.24244 type:complete len:217 (-) Transcript_8484:210-860(-)